MVIDFFPFDIDPLLGIGLIHFFFQKVRKENNKTVICQIVILFVVMVTESFGYRPSPRDWSNVFSKSKKKKKKIFDWNPPNEIGLIWVFQKVEKIKNIKN